MNLLQYFITNKYIINARNEEDRTFYDNATLFEYIKKNIIFILLFRFCPKKIEDFLNNNASLENRENKRNIRRISSFKAETLQSYQKNCNR